MKKYILLSLLVILNCTKKTLAQSLNLTTITDPITLCASDQPARNTYGSIMGINFLNYNDIPAGININDICTSVRYFHLMDGGSGRDFKDLYPSGYTPTICTNPILSPIINSTNCYTCTDPLQMGDMRARYCNAKRLGATKINASIETIRNGGFPDKMFNQTEWGSTSSIAFNNARDYGKKFAENYCPKEVNKACLVDVLELGNEPWGVPGTEYYQAIYRGIIHGVNDYYNTLSNPITYTNTYTIPAGLNKSSWRMKISTGAYQTFQTTNFWGTNDIIATFPTDAWNYVENVNIHPYGFQLNRNTSGQITSYTNDLNQHPESKNGLFLSILNGMKWRNSNQGAKKFGITEFGWDSGTVGTDAQALYITRALLMAGRMDVDEAVLYEMFDNLSLIGLYATSGLIQNSTTFKPAYYAVKRFKRLLGDKIFLKKFNVKDYEDTDNKYFAYLIGGANRIPTHLVVWLPKTLNNGQNTSYTETVSIANFPTNYSVNTGANTIKINANSSNTDDTVPTSQIVSINGSTVSITASATPYLIPLNTNTFTFAAPSGNVSISTCNSICATPSPVITNGTQNLFCNGTSTTISGSCSSGTISWAFPSGQTNLTPVTTTTGTFIYSATCNNGTCTSAPSTSTVTVTGNCGTTCPISFTSFNETTTNITTTPCPQNPVTYDLNFTSSTAYSNSTDIIITGVPVSQYLGYTSTSGSTITDIYPGGVRQLKWTFPSIATGTTYNAKFSFCYVNPVIHVTATTTRNSSMTCDKLSGLGSGCTTPATPTLTVSPSTISSGQSSTLTASACTNGTNTFYNASTNALLTSPVSPTSTTSYYAKCTIGACVSANSTSVQVTVSSSCPVTVNTANFITVTSGAKTFYVSKIQAPFQSSGSAFDFANNSTTMCKSLNANARLATITNATENTAIKSAISTNGTSGNNYFIGYSNKTGTWAWNGGTSTFLPSGFTTTGSAVNSAVQLVSYTPGWAINGINATSYFVCEVPCQNGSATRVGASEGIGNDETESNLFTIYPNPTNDKLTVEYNLTKDSEINFGIMDMTGKNVQNRVIEGKAGTHSFVMDVSKISEGAYILRGIAEDKSQAKKFVIVR